MTDEPVIERERIDVMFKTVPDDQAGITAGWTAVERAVPLRGASSTAPST